jgi:hypothetical protein
MEVYFQSILDDATESVRESLSKWNNNQKDFFEKKNYGLDIKIFRFFFRTINFTKPFSKKYMRKEKIFLHTYDLSWQDIVESNSSEIEKILYETIFCKFEELIPEKSKKIDFDFKAFKTDLLLFIKEVSRIKVM